MLHRLYVLLCWRLELYGQNLTKILGRRAFSLYAVDFSIIGIARVSAVFALALANQGTLPGDSVYLK